MAGSMENDGFWMQRGDGSPEELQGFAKTWRTKYSAVQRSKHFHNVISCVVFHQHSILICHVYTPEKLSLALVPRPYVLRMSMKLAYRSLACDVICRHVGGR